MDQKIDEVVMIFLGTVVVIVAAGMAIRTFMIPGASPPLINRFVFRITQGIFDFICRPLKSDERRHKVLSVYAPISLLAVLATILFLIGLGYTLIFYGVGVQPFMRAFLFSGSALSTLGFESPGNDVPVILLSAIEAISVTTIVALLIGYLPGIYSSYQDREAVVTNLDSLVGSQPDGVKVIESYVHANGAAKLGNLWQTWIEWFGALASARSTVSGELYLRSSRWDRSWVSAAGSILDAAALIDSSVDLSTDPTADRLVRRGALALQEVLQPLDLHCPDAPAWPATPINVSQQEFNEAFDQLKDLGLPMKPDKNAAWEQFASLRVLYECSLMTLVSLKKPPRGARWTTDRPGIAKRLPLPVTPRAKA